MANKPSNEVRKLRFLSVEIFKTIKDLRISFMKEIFNLNTTRDVSRNKLLVKSQNTKKYGTDSLRSLGPKIWNNLPIELKNTNNLDTFKALIKTWAGPSCSCKLCSYQL